MDCLQNDTVKTLQKVKHAVNIVPKDAEIDDKKYPHPRMGNILKKTITGAPHVRAPNIACCQARESIAHLLDSRTMMLAKMRAYLIEH